MNNVIQTLEKISDKDSRLKDIFNNTNIESEPFSQKDLNKKFLSTESSIALSRYEDSLKLYQTFKTYEETYDVGDRYTSTRSKILEIDKNKFERSLPSDDSPSNYLSDKQLSIANEFENSNGLKSVISNQAKMDNLFNDNNVALETKREQQKTLKLKN